MTPEPPRPLVVRFGAMGDTVILLTLIRMLHQRFGVPIDVLSCGGWTRPLLEGQPGVGAVYLLRSSRLPYRIDRDKWQMAATLRERRHSMVWACQYVPRARQVLHDAGIADSSVIDMTSIEAFRPTHIVDRYACFAQCTPAAYEGLDAIRPTGNVDILSVPPLTVPPAHRRATQSWLQQVILADRPLILLQPGNKRTMRWWRPRQRASNTKYWPERHWASVVRALHETEPRAEILLLGVQAEAGLNRDILKLARVARAHNLAGQVPIPRLLALQEIAYGMVSVDTGPAHSAAALDCPLVVLFGTVDPALYAPRSPSQSVEVVTGGPVGYCSMEDISPHEVIAAWQKLEDARRQRATALPRCAPNRPSLTPTQTPPRPFYPHASLPAWPQARAPRHSD